MADVCTDGRFDMIKRVKEKLVINTNIGSNPDEMKVIDSILFRFWQMGWLELIDKDIPDMMLRYCIEYVNPNFPFLDNGKLNIRHFRVKAKETAESVLTLILSCGCKIVNLYRGTVTAGNLEDWETPMIVEEDDWVTDEWLDSLKRNKTSDTEVLKKVIEELEIDAEYADRSVLWADIPVTVSVSGYAQEFLDKINVWKNGGETD